VQEYYDAVMASFSTFTGQTTEEAEVVKSSFQTLLTKVVEGSNSKSKILSSGATGILESYTQIHLDDLTAKGIIAEFTRVLPFLMSSYRKVVTGLTCVLGWRLPNAVNRAISELECEFTAYVKKFAEGDGNGRKIEVDYEPVMKRVQKLTDTIALKGNVKLTECQLKDPKVQQALVVLSWVLDYTMVLVHGLSSSSEEVIKEQECEPTPVLHVIVVSVRVFITETVESLVVNTVPNALNVLAHLETIGNSSNKLFDALSAVLKSVGQIAQQVTSTVDTVTRGLLTPLRLIGKK
jgi:hypothetical protein